MKALVLGPILYAITSDKRDEWAFGIGVLLSCSADDDLVDSSLGKTSLTVDGGVEAECKPAFIHQFPPFGAGVDQHVFARWDVRVKRTGATRRASYRLEIPECTPVEVRGVSIPGQNDLPRLAFFSCNGASSSRVWNRLERPFERWEELREVQEEKGIELLIGGGDQLYADSIWDLPVLAGYVGSNWQKNVDDKPVTPEVSAALLEAYVGLYVQRWREESLSSVMARVPGMYTWDDHDIFDGWGSHGKLQESPIFQAVFSQAALAFRIIQLGGVLDDQPQGARFLKTLAFTGGDEGKDTLDVVLPDTRSYRETRQVLGSTQWDALDGWFRQRSRNQAAGRRHVLFVSPVPVVYSRFSEVVEAAASIADLRDDLIDQWESSKHRGERARLIMTLLEHQADSRSAVTILSGDVHLAARAEIRSRNPRHLFGNHSEVIVNQVTSSGIVHPPPSRLEYLGLRAVTSNKPDDIGHHVETVLLPVGGRDHLLARNWLFIDFDRGVADERNRARMWIEWRAGSDSPDTKVVVEPPQP